MCMTKIDQDTYESGRRLRLFALQNEGGNTRKQFRDHLSTVSVVGNLDLIDRAFKFACDIEYQHGGLSKSAYLAHPLRVAMMVMKYTEPPNVINIITALLHNVYEVGHVSSSKLTKLFDHSVAETISILTVDRELQWDDNYKERYYSTILNSHDSAAIVKVLDKLDNIYLICTNPDSSIRNLYIKEVFKYVIPMAQNIFPEVAELLIYLARRAQLDGYVPIEAINMETVS